MYQDRSIMSNYIEFEDKIAFHLGYYIKEIVDDSGLTQEDFAKQLGTTPKNLSLLIRREQNLSIDITMKLPRKIDEQIEQVRNFLNVTILLAFRKNMAVSFRSAAKELSESGEQEEIADKYAEDMLIPYEQYKVFLAENRFDVQSIKIFAKKIERDPGIVLGRLLNDGKVEYNDWTLNGLRHKYRVQTR